MDASAQWRGEAGGTRPAESTQSFTGRVWVPSCCSTRAIASRAPGVAVCLVAAFVRLTVASYSVVGMIRADWHLENRLHWVRDMTFAEDHSQIRTGHGPAVMATLRNLAISIHRRHCATNIAANLAAATRHITVHTDAWRGYRGLDKLGYDHQPRSQRAAHAHGEDIDEILPQVHRVISNLKGWLQSTHRGVSGEHLQVYLDEFALRFNRRRTPMAAFQTLLGLQRPTCYRSIVAAGPGSSDAAELTG